MYSTHYMLPLIISVPTQMIYYELGGLVGGVLVGLMHFPLWDVINMLHTLDGDGYYLKCSHL